VPATLFVSYFCGSVIDSATRRGRREVDDAVETMPTERVGNVLHPLEHEPGIVGTASRCPVDRSSINRDLVAGLEQPGDDDTADVAGTTVTSTFIWEFRRKRDVARRDEPVDILKGHAPARAACPRCPHGVDTSYRRAYRSQTRSQEPEILRECAAPIGRAVVGAGMWDAARLPSARSVGGPVHMSAYDHHATSSRGSVLSSRTPGVVQRVPGQEEPR